jgi:hypothetical protein
MILTRMRMTPYKDDKGEVSIYIDEESFIKTPEAKVLDMYYVCSICNGV